MSNLFFNFFLVIVLPGICIIMGLVSLITQKIYKIDDTGKTVVEIPLFGKMTTNYPALAFVFLGLAASIILYKNVYAIEEDWEITGKLVATDSYDFSTARITIFPQSYTVKGPTKNGSYSISIKLPQNITFEQAIQRLTIETPDKLLPVFPMAEYELYNKDKDKSQLTKITENSRDYIIKYE